MSLIFLNENIVDEYNEISEQDKSSLDTLNFVGNNYKAGLNINLMVSNFSPYNNNPFKDKLSDDDLKRDTVSEEKSVDTQVLQVVEINNQRGFATDFVKQMASCEYRRILDSTKKPIKKKRARKSMKALMQQSVFHGKNWLGNNFIA